MFKGEIVAGSDVQATFSANHTSSGSAHLLMAVGRFSGGSDADSGTAPPGGSTAVKLDHVAEGVLEILVDMKLESDTGQLEVLVNGKRRDSVAVTGDQRWTYSVEA
jgi:hypothetical protein